MAPSDETFAAAVRIAAETVADHGLEHPDRLAPAADALAEAAAAAPGPEVGRLVDRCAEAVRAVFAGDAGEPLAAVAAVEEALAAALDAARDAPGGAARLREAGPLLENALAMGMPREPAAPADPVALLNDAAARLLQIGPEAAAEELIPVRDALARAAEFPDVGPACREAAAEALEIAEAARAGAAAEAADIESIGAAIGRALQALEERGKEPAPTPAGEEPVDHMPPDADLDLIAAFIAESGDLITGAEDALLDLETDPADPDAVSNVFRAFHNIKGTSAFFELELMTELSHHAESILSRVRDGKIRYAGGYPDLALRSVDMLKALFQRLESALGGGAFRKPPGYDDLLRDLADPAAAGITDAGPGDAAPPPPDAAKETAPAAGAEPRADDGEPVCPPDEVPVCRPEGDDGAAPAPDRRSAMAHRAASMESSIRVPIQRLDRFIDMVGELVVAHSMVAQDPTVTGGNHHELVKKVGQTGKIVRELQSMSMSMRMIPLKTTFRKMARLVRDLSRKVGKDVRFAADGEETEIDRNMVDIINDPLVHMVRNAIDHGIEAPDDRERAGKPRHGTVHLSAFHSAGNVVVEIRDDGRGLDRDRILAKAAERGLISEGTGLSDREAYSLIFEPGFSTAKIVSDVSGRGVGMDVVKRNIEAIRGHVEIDAEPGRGSIFRMSLPLTLAIIDGMVVRVGAEKYVIPTISIVRSVQPDPAEVTSVMRRGRMLNLQGRLIPLFRLADLFSVENAESELARTIAVVVENDASQAGLLVDELIGSQQIVIKTMGESLGNIPGISGSAIMPDGRVGLILDVGGLVRLANRE
jgi:two-component system chemotaxis sensor kinase CheA